MADGFSLGAAIGATGKFPKLKAPTINDEAADRAARELQSVRNRVTVDNAKYHKVFIEENKNETSKFIQGLLMAEKSKDPSVVDKTYTGEIDLNAKRNNFLNYSDQFFNIEKKIEDAESQRSEEFVSPGMKALYNVLKTSNSKEELYDKYMQNAGMFADGYVEVERTQDGFVVPKVKFHNKYDFPRVFNKGDVFQLKDKGVIISEKKNKSADGMEIDRYISIPANREEALFLKKTDPNINESANAYDLGKEWFKINPNAQLQFRAQLASDDEPDALDPYKMTFDDLYNQLYDKHVKPNIPKRYENSDKMSTRNNFFVNVSTGQKVAPTDFTVGPLTANYNGKTNSLRTDLSASVSSEADGTLAQIPTNAYIVSLDNAKPAFTTTAQKDFKINRVAILPSIKVKDTKTGVVYLRPITEEEKVALDKAGTKYLMYPFAIGNQRQLNVSKAPEVGVGGYAIPLYEPDKNGKWIVPKESRKVKTTGGSPLLSQIVQRNKWDEDSQKNWDEAFFKMMNGVRDEDDIK